MASSPFDPGSGVGWSVDRAAPIDAPARGDAPAGPRYTAGALVGQGGMGQVRVAHDAVLRREVAVKELGPHLRQDPVAAARLAREAWITAALDHPSIIAVHDAGQGPDGAPFYTMRLVRGQSLDSALRAAPSLNGRLALLRHLLHAAEALGAAHEAGVVHRDVKPANILIGRHGDTALVDWGLAAAPGREETEPGVVGTPAYMSPEQAAGAAPDPRADVYALGATLYALLAGRPPRLVDDIAAAQAGAVDPLRQTAPAAPAELVAIAERALAVDPAARYPDAAALADELLAWFEGRRVAAHDYSAAELIGRLWRRFRLTLSVGLVAIALVATALLAGYHRAAQERERAVAAEAVARRQLAATEVEQAIAALAEDARARAERLAAAALRIADDPLARGVLAAYGRTPRPVRAETRPAPPCTWMELSALGLLCGARDAVTLFAGAPLQARWTVAAPAIQGGLRGGQIVLRQAADTRHLLDPATGALRRVDPPSHDPWEPVLRELGAYLPDGRWPGRRVVAPPPCPFRLQLLVASEDGKQIAGLCPDGQLLLGGVDDPALRVVATPITGERQGLVARFLPGGDRLLIGGLRGSLHLIAVPTGALLASYESSLGTIQALEPSPDGAVVAVSGDRGGVGLWSLATPSWLGELPAQLPRALRYEADGLWVADGALTRWTIPAVAGAHRVGAPTGLGALRFSPQGDRLVLAGGGGLLRVVDPATGAILDDHPFGDAVVKAIALRSDGLLVVSGMSSPQLAAGLHPDALAALPGARPLRRILFTADGALVGADLDRGLFRWPALDQPPQRLATDRGFIDLEDDGQGAALVVDERGAVERLGEQGLEPLLVAPGAVAVAGQGGRLFVATAEAVTLYNAKGEVEQTLSAPGAGLKDLAVSPDGRYVAAGGADTRAYVWERSTGRLRAALPGHAERVAALTFDPTSAILATASWDHTVRLWDLSVLDASAAALAAPIEASWAVP